MSESEPADAATGPAMLRVADVDGLPEALGRRLAECDADASERTAIAHDRGAQTTVVRARDTAALEWLYDWLDTFAGDDRVERAAADVADAVESELDARLVTDGGVDRSAVFDVISEVEKEILAEDKLGASRDQIVEGTCQRIRDRLRDLDDDDPKRAVEITEEEAIEELGGGAATAEIDEDDLFTDGGTAQEPVDARAWQPRAPRCRCGTALTEFVSRVEARRLARIYADDGEIPACPACTAPRSGETGATDIPTAIKVKTAHYRGEGL